MPDDQISLRPRMTINVDLHPESYDLFRRTPEKRHNALAMQMLVRLATIERYSTIRTVFQTRDWNRRSRGLSNAKADDQIGLRPRLTIFKDLHPELYEKFKRTSSNSHNGLAMQMLSRMAELDQHAGLGEVTSTHDVISDRFATMGSKQVTTTDPDIVIKEPVTAPETSPAPAVINEAIEVEKSPDSSTEDLSILALKNAVGDMFMQ